MHETCVYADHASSQNPLVHVNPGVPQVHPGDPQVHVNPFDPAITQVCCYP